MPPKAGPGRARTLATLQGITHDRLTDPKLGELLTELEQDGSLEAQRCRAAYDDRYGRSEHDLRKDRRRHIADRVGLVVSEHLRFFV